ncbi:hypothetical protein, partial [Ectopseudomonas khazarica]|uniref:hypothetical protein n=1 Tax=Ectopseudomonas khazarica TaxID=2502979 RepID=UPI001ABF8654
PIHSNAESNARTPSSDVAMINSTFIGSSSLNQFPIIVKGGFIARTQRALAGTATPFTLTLVQSQ